MSEKPYKVIIPGINGGGSQVFEAETPEEMQQQFQQDQENATAKIRELASQNEQLQNLVEQGKPAAAATAGPDGFDKQKYFNLLYESPVEAQKYAMQFVLGAPVDDFIKEYQTVRGGAFMGIQNAVNAQFAQKHPELLQVPQEDDAHNAEVISKILTDNGWTYNLNNLEAAFAVAKTNNQLKLNTNSFAPEAILPVAPTTVSRPTGQVNTSESENEFLHTAPLAKVKEYLEKKYANTRA